MPNRILTLRRKRNETSEICTVFYIRYMGALSAELGGTGGTTYTFGSGIQQNVAPKKITVLYEENAGNISHITISDDEFSHNLTISDPDIQYIVIEESDEDYIVIEESDEDYIVIEESDEDYNTDKKMIRITIPSSNEDFKVESKLNRASVAVG